MCKNGTDRRFAAANSACNTDLENMFIGRRQQKYSKANKQLTNKQQNTIPKLQNKILYEACLELDT
jgi:hypothetical protein